MEESMFEAPNNIEQRPFVTVLYEEWKPETYAGIEIFLPDGEIHKQNSGDFVRDYMRVVEEYSPFSKSSTVDSYMKDAGIRLD